MASQGAMISFFAFDFARSSLGVGRFGKPPSLRKGSVAKECTNTFFAVWSLI